MPDENGNLSPAEIAAQNAHAAAQGPSLAEQMGQSHASGAVGAPVVSGGTRTNPKEPWARGGPIGGLAAVAPGAIEQNFQANAAPAPAAPTQNAQPNATLTGGPRQGDWGGNDRGVGPVGDLPGTGVAGGGPATAPSGQGGLAQTVYGESQTGAGLPPGIRREGNAYSGTNASMNAAVPPQAGADQTQRAAGGPMTTEQANEYYQKLNAAMTAKENQGREDQRSWSATQTQDSALRRDIENAKSESRVANWYAQNQPDQVSGTNRAGGAYTSVPRAAAGGIAKAQDAANTRLGALETAQQGTAKTLAQQRNYIDEYAKATPSLADAREQQIKLGLGGLQGQQEAQKVQLGGQAVQAGGMQLHFQQHLTDLQSRAAGTGPDAKAAQDALAFYQKAQSGKGGPITEEDALKVFGDMTTRAVMLGGPEAYRSLPHFNDFYNSLRGGPQGPPGGMSLQQFKAQAQAQKSKMSDAELTAYYNKNWGGGQGAQQ